MKSWTKMPASGTQNMETMRHTGKHNERSKHRAQFIRQYKPEANYYFIDKKENSVFPCSGLGRAQLGNCVQFWASALERGIHRWSVSTEGESTQELSHRVNNQRGATSQK